ncbi:hypothetical protein [Nocardia transvalensis]|uniref:hypothetical protein n=1 Tax=Nocardia transvalensis TaxID=37333 RepID=UPI0018961156|nr:hypothetical protein [Nocardia transvalensis]MBF6333677.1 hypothetical protein [Nocardia transvalensis]
MMNDIRGPLISFVAFLVLAVVYVLALRADVMWLCALLLWIPIGLTAALYGVSMARVSRRTRAARHGRGGVR